MKETGGRGSLELGIAAAKSGSRLIARLHLSDAAERSPQDSLCWLWLAFMAESPAEAVAALQKSLAIDPDNEIAWAGLRWVQGLSSSSRVDPALAEPAPARSTAKPRPAPTVGLLGTPPPMPRAEPPPPPAAPPRATRPGFVERAEPFPSTIEPPPRPEPPHAAPTNAPAPPPLIPQQPMSSLVALLAETAGPMPDPEPTDEFSLEELVTRTTELPPGPSFAPEPPSEDSLGLPTPLYDRPALATFSARLNEDLPPPRSDIEPEGPSSIPYVLVVDDSPTVCKLVTITLSNNGYRVASSADGVEAVAMISKHKPDLILLDITMPRLDGYKLCKLVRSHQDTKHIPVIMLSGKDGFFDKTRGKFAGCTDYITKPFDPEVLLQTVRGILPTEAPGLVASGSGLMRARRPVGQV